MKKIVLFGFILLASGFVNAQIIDNYGLRFGTGLSNQYWDYKNGALSTLSGWNDNKIGIIGQLYAEKNFGKYFSFRPAIGYLQKGYIDDITLIFPNGEELAINDNRVILHDLSLDLSLKITPLDKILKPYILLGLRGDYLLDYRSIIVDFQGKSHELNTSLYNSFNKFTLGGIIGVGLLYNDMIFMDLEYNPAITKNLELSFLSINDKFFSLTLGLNINQLIKD